MDKHRPKRPTSLDLFPRRQTQTGSQDSINNNSLGKKDSWKASPQITGDGKPPAKAEDKVRHVTRRPAPKPPANGANGRTGASDARVRTREKPPPPATNPPSSGTARTQRRAGAGGAVPARGGGRGGTAAREGDVRRKDGAAGREDRKGGRLCEEFKTRDKDRSGHSRLREANGPKSRGADGKGGAKGAHRGGGQRANNPACSQEVYLTAMVVPRTPVAPRNQDKTQTQGQNHDRPPDSVPALSRSSSEGGSNRMSLGSDTEGPPPGPPQPGGPHPLNPDITEEEGEGDPTPCAVFQTGPSRRPLEDGETQMDSTKSEVDAGGGVGAEVVEGSGAGWGAEAGQGGATSQSAAGLCYDAVKYTLVVDEHARLELVSLKDCFHGYPNKHNEDSDTETVYQSANEEEDPEYEEERRREEEVKRRREEEVKRRREEEVKRRREVVARVCKQPKMTSTSASASEDDESRGGRAYRSRKFLNLFAKGSGQYSAAGAGSFGLFSCVLDGAERQQSHRAVYRFVPRHEDELYLEIDDPVLIMDQSEDLWCHGYNMRSGSTGIFPAFYTVEVTQEPNPALKEGWTEQFLVRFLGSVQVPVHKGNSVLCAAMQKVVGNRQLSSQPPSACVLEVSVRGVKISVQDRCHSAHRGDQCFHFFHLKNISFCGCHPKHSKYFGFITKHPEQQRFACHVMVSETTLSPLAESVGRAFQQYYREHVGVFCPTEDIFIE
ncbi:LOW QUALITY PROTEIN: C-Jun-amino-terminal kinase-interacting protein 1-like [Takifugu flavidus]|uniref:LOW QUALITY PROTEIN: C-Jun-amino-terminal kinase-interacting protein 1-like n=1 Tax=Takifugu flavidus TaxID=433684 RepID=UPI0025444D11|nr:LOW QUALITY PROTEIN: C-Jun-amino-terminal kinase-interacting protein 1-like [Takifugu flavidus]